MYIAVPSNEAVPSYSIVDLLSEYGSIIISWINPSSDDAVMFHLLFVGSTLVLSIAPLTFLYTCQR